MSGVVIGMNPHKRSATLEIINDREQALDKGRFTTDTDGYRQMLLLVQSIAQRAGETRLIYYVTLFRHGRQDRGAATAAG